MQQPIQEGVCVIMMRLSCVGLLLESWYALRLCLSSLSPCAEGDSQRPDEDIESSMPTIGGSSSSSSRSSSSSGEARPGKQMLFFGELLQ